MKETIDKIDQHMNDVIECKHNLDLYNELLRLSNVHMTKIETRLGDFKKELDLV